MQTDNHETEQEDLWSQWAAQAQSGDKSAYDRLLRDIIPFIKSVIAPRVANRDWVDDITQEVLVSVHKALHTYSPERPFKPWLSSIIHFRKTDFLRRHYRTHKNSHVPLDNADFQKTHVTEYTMAGEYRDMEKALSHLPEKQRNIFLLMKIEGYTAREVADKMNMSVSAVKVSVHRSSGKIKKIMGKNGYK